MTGTALGVATTPRRGNGDVMLRVEGLSVSYHAGAVGVDGFHCEVQTASVAALVGPNGGGKSSSLRGIAGFLRREPVSVRAKRIDFRGEDIRHVPPRGRVKRGLLLVPETDKIFSGLTVREQLELGWTARRRGRFSDVVTRWLDIFPAMAPHLDRRGGYLSGGQRQMVAILMALCASPEFLMIDEVTLGLSPAVTVEIVRALGALADEGVTLLLADQNATVVSQLAEELFVFEAGRCIAQGKPDALARDPEVRRAYLGTAAEEPQSKGTSACAAGHQGENLDG